MPGRAFVDTNVLLYLLSAIPAKVSRARELITVGGVIGVQVLNEFANAARNKHAATWPEIRTVVDAFCDVFDVEPLTLEVHRLGARLADRYGYSVYDSLLLACALKAGCDTFWSEDLHDGQVIEGRLTIRNPFI